MDSDKQNTNQGPVSFDSAIDMDAINAAVEASAGQNAETAESSFDVNAINLDNTPTTNEELEKQLQDNPGMSLASSANPPVSEESTPNTEENSTAEPAPTEDMSSHVAVGDVDPFSSPVPPPQKEEEEMTIDSESKAPGTITINAAKMQDNAMKALNAIKPKNSTGVIILASIGSVVVLGIIIAILLFI